MRCQTTAAVPKRPVIRGAEPAVSTASGRMHRPRDGGQRASRKRKGGRRSQHAPRCAAEVRLLAGQGQQMTIASTVRVQLRESAEEATTCLLTCSGRSRGVGSSEKGKRNAAEPWTAPAKRKSNPSRVHHMPCRSGADSAYCNVT
jgi:hypothetical protein